MAESMKQSDIKKCLSCGDGVMHDNQIAFYTLDVTHWIVDIGAVRRQAGLELMMGQAAVLAQVLGPDEDIAKPIETTKDVWVCQLCANTVSMAEILAKAEPPEDTK